MRRLVAPRDPALPASARVDMAGNRRSPPVMPPAGGIRALGRIGSLGPGFRLFRIIARFSKYDFWIPDEILD